MDGLGIRASNCLSNCNIKSREEALAAFKSGVLQPGKKGPRNYGLETHKQVAKWLGFPEPKKPTRRVRIPKVCPHCGGSI